MFPVWTFLHIFQWIQKSNVTLNPLRAVVLTHFSASSKPDPFSGYLRCYFTVNVHIEGPVVSFGCRDVPPVAALASFSFPAWIIKFCAEEQKVSWGTLRSSRTHNFCEDRKFAEKLKTPTETSEKVIFPFKCTTKVFGNSVKGNLQIMHRGGWFLLWKSNGWTGPVTTVWKSCDGPSVLWAFTLEINVTKNDFKLPNFEQHLPGCWWTTLFFDFFEYCFQHVLAVLGSEWGKCLTKKFSKGKTALQDGESICWFRVFFIIWTVAMKHAIGVNLRVVTQGLAENTNNFAQLSFHTAMQRRSSGHQTKALAVFFNDSSFF